VAGQCASQRQVVLGVRRWAGRQAQVRADRSCMAEADAKPASQAGSRRLLTFELQTCTLAALFCLVPLLLTRLPRTPALHTAHHTPRLHDGSRWTSFSAPTSSSCGTTYGWPARAPETEHQLATACMPGRPAVPGGRAPGRHLGTLYPPTPALVLQPYASFPRLPCCTLINRMHASCEMLTALCHLAFFRTPPAFLAPSLCFHQVISPAAIQPCALL